MARRLQRLAGGLLRCHASAAETAFLAGSADDESCESAALKPFEASIAKLNPGCPACLGSGVESAGWNLVRFLDQDNARVFCAGSTPLGGDDSGFVPPDGGAFECEARVAKAAGRLASGIMRCHTKTAAARFKDQPFDEEACEHAAAAHFDTTVGNLKSCPACVVQNAAAVRDAIESQLDGANGAIYCAGSVPF
jgi:hypothetical protein